jgi:hypothetical protein
MATTPALALREAESIAIAARAKLRELLAAAALEALRRRGA